MSRPLICHFMIGCPGSGKSTLAARLAREGSLRIVSTDKIREALYGDESIQGDWAVIEAHVLYQIHSAIASNQPIIYDATNAKREWRVALLRQLKNENVQWVAWYLQTPLDICKAQNQRRKRRVPDSVIESMFKSLEDCPPQLAEGFVTVNILKDNTDGFISTEIRDSMCPYQRLQGTGYYRYSSSHSFINSLKSVNCSKL